MKTAFILGNGTSRNPIDVANLPGDTFGCNAIYRDFMPTFLFAVDKRMVDEFGVNQLDPANVYVKPYTNMQYKFQTIPVRQGRGMCSGVAATRTAVAWGYEKIVLLGMDLSGHKGYINNVYAGTKNYASEKHRAINSAKWIEHISETLEANKNIVWERVVDEHCLIPKGWQSKMTHWTVDEFLLRIGAGLYE